MGCPLPNPSLFTLKFLIVLKSRIVAKSQTLVFVFPRSDSIDQVVLECRERAH